MELGRVGVLSQDFLLHRDRAEIAEAAVELEELGFGALFSVGWLGGEEIFPSFDRLLGATQRVPVVSAVVNIWRHTPEETVQEFADFERRYPGRFHLGLGTSHAPALDPGEHRRPLTAMGEYLDEVDRLGDGVPSTRRLLAAMGPKMMDLARERAAGTVPVFVPVEHTRLTRERLGPEAVIAVEQSVLFETNPGVARDFLRKTRMKSLEMPNYSNNLRRLGFDEGELAAGGSDRLVDALIAWGDEESIARRIAEHHDAGADHVCVQVVHAGESLPREQWRRLAAVLS